MFLNRSFARRIGKTLSNSQKEILSLELPEYLFSNNALLKKISGQEVFLEIGFGMGEHFIHQLSKKRDAVFIGVEVYLNGVANVLRISKKQNITNFLLWPKDLDLILESLPPKILNGVYLLFPDPWFKRRQYKRRIFNNERLMILQNKLKENGLLIFASDVDDYFELSKNILLDNTNFKLLNKDFSQPHHDYITTRYHQKATGAGREAKFFQAALV